MSLKQPSVAFAHVCATTMMARRYNVHGQEVAAIVPLWDFRGRVGNTLMNTNTLERAVAGEPDRPSCSDWDIFLVKLCRFNPRSSRIMEHQTFLESS